MELDFCCSNKVAKKIQSRYYEVIHLLFRVSEVVSRTLMHVMFVTWIARLHLFLGFSGGPTWSMAVQSVLKAWRCEGRSCSFSKREHWWSFAPISSLKVP